MALRKVQINIKTLTNENRKAKRVCLLVNLKKEQKITRQKLKVAT